MEDLDNDLRMWTFAKFSALRLEKHWHRNDRMICYLLRQKKKYHGNLMHFFSLVFFSFSTALRAWIVFLSFSEAFLFHFVSFHSVLVLLFFLVHNVCWESHSIRNLFFIDLFFFLVFSSSLSLLLFPLPHSHFFSFPMPQGMAWTNKSFIPLTNFCLWLPLSSRLLFIAFVDAKCQVDNFNWISVAVT